MNELILHYDSAENLTQAAYGVALSRYGNGFYLDCGLWETPGGHDQSVRSYRDKLPRNPQEAITEVQRIAQGQLSAHQRVYQPDQQHRQFPELAIVKDVMNIAAETYCHYLRLYLEAQPEDANIAEIRQQISQAIMVLLRHFDRFVHDNNFDDVSEDSLERKRVYALKYHPPDLKLHKIEQLLNINRLKRVSGFNGIDSRAFLGYDFKIYVGEGKQHQLVLPGGDSYGYGVPLHHLLPYLNGVEPVHFYHTAQKLFLDDGTEVTDTKLFTINPDGTIDVTALFRDLQEQEKARQK